MFFSVEASRARITVALLCVYLLWGSAFVALRYAVQAVHPALVAGLRFLIAGSVLMCIGVLQREPVRLKKHDAGRVALLGLIMFTCNTLLVAYGCRTVSAGTAALTVSTIPLFIAMLEAGMPGGVRLRWPLMIGMTLGTLGIAVLLGVTRPERVSGQVKLAVLVLLLAAFAWAVGTVMLRRTHFSAPTLVCVAWQMLIGGAANTLIGIASGGIRQSSFHLRSMEAILYLSLLGTLAGYTSYAYLLQHVTPSTAATYAYVNPIVAALLGWALLHEQLHLHEWIGMVTVLSAVAIILFADARVPNARVRASARS